MQNTTILVRKGVNFRVFHEDFTTTHEEFDTFSHEDVLPSKMARRDSRTKARGGRVTTNQLVTAKSNDDPPPFSRPYDDGGVMAGLGSKGMIQLIFATTLTSVINIRFSFRLFLIYFLTRRLFTRRVIP